MVDPRWLLGGFAALASTGCVIVEDDYASDSGFPQLSTGRGSGDEGLDDANLPPSDVDDDDVSDDPMPDDGTDGPMLDCGRNVVEDGGFEAGSPSVAWTEASPLFGSPICNDDCSEDEGAEAYNGEWFAWFGGALEPDTASLTQTFAVSADSARLTFRFAINAAAGTGDDVFAVSVDGNTVFMRTDADIDDFADYTQIPVTLDQWADGQPHVLRFESDVTGDALTNFFVDNVAVVGCGELGEVTDSTGAVVDDTGIEPDSTGDSGTSDSGTSDSGTSDSGTASTATDSSGGSSGSGTSGSSGSVGSDTAGSDSGTAGTTDSGATDSGTTDSGTTAG